MIFNIAGGENEFARKISRTSQIIDLHNLKSVHENIFSVKSAEDIVKECSTITSQDGKLP